MEQSEAVRLLNQLTDRSVAKTDANVFFREVQGHLESVLLKKEQEGKVDALETEINLLVQISSMTRIFSEYQRDKADGWLTLLEKKTRKSKRSKLEEKPKQTHLKPIWSTELCSYCFRGENVAPCENDCGHFLHKNCAKDEVLCRFCKGDISGCFWCFGRSVLLDIKPKSDRMGLVLCGAKHCEKKFHQSCLEHLVGEKKKCPLHCCFSCKKALVGTTLSCLLCPKAYHYQCLSLFKIARLTSKFIFCENCLPSVLEDDELSKALIKT